MFPKRVVQLLVYKRGKDVKMVDGSACKDISIGIVKGTEKDGVVCTLKVVRYILEAYCNLISIGVFD